MAAEYSVEVCRELEEKFRQGRLHRPMRVEHYDAGQELVYDVTSVAESKRGRVCVVVERFVGGGYAGQVYRVRISAIKAEDGPIGLLEVGGVYAMKILIPPSCFSRVFRNVLYWVGFQGPFQPQVNPAAARAGALWQKFIRQAAAARFGQEGAVNDVHATFVDSTLGSCGELSDWVEGRTWRLEVDDQMDLLKRWRAGRKVNEEQLGSAEYREKKKFMADFVELLHEMGAYEFARQYEWWTCKSQPNCLKRQGTEDDPSGGLVAVDFRAGLALLPFLPMSPGDFKLIGQGVARGSLVQFDRGDVGKLAAFVEAHSDEFAAMPRWREMMDELRAADGIYRDSVPDITHNNIRLVYSGRLWSTIFDSAVTGWKVRNLIDARGEKKLRGSGVLTLLFFVIGLIPLLGRVFRRILARADWRRHYGQMLVSWGYLERAIRGRIVEKVIAWHRGGRVDGERGLKIAESFGRFLCHLPLSILPGGWHRFVTDWEFFKDKLYYVFIRPFKLYFSAKLREQWLREMVDDGKKKHILSEQDAETILSQLHERYIQRYLVSLVVHLLTLPLTQIVSVIAAWIYYGKTGDKYGAAGIVALFQVIPISPGSIARGLYAVGIMIYDRSFKDYNIAVFLSFVKYIGYLAFPIQMTYRYPALARFMASHWATVAVHIVPVFGERGALLEHWVFRLFYNWPLTIRRRMRRRAELRASMKPRYWHVGMLAAAATGIFVGADFAYFRTVGVLPWLKDIWWLAVLVAVFCGAGVTVGCGGATLWKRIVAGTVCGVAVGVAYTAIGAITGPGDVVIWAGELAKSCVWRVFVFGVLSTVGAIITELKLRDPDLRR